MPTLSKMLITQDYSTAPIDPANLDNLKAIGCIELSQKYLEDNPNLLIFPDSFSTYDRGMEGKRIYSITPDEKRIETNSIVGFIGRNETYVSIHSRFARGLEQDYFLHYMLQRVAKINLVDLQHSVDEDSVFDFLIYLFPSYLKRATQQGIYKEYTTKIYNDAHVRGVIDLSRHIRYNEPFNGKVAYTSREYSYDNSVTQLVRHTIEYIKRHKRLDKLLNTDSETQQAVYQIINSTPSYTPNQRQAVIHKNLRPKIHPYYNEYRPLQTLCLQILRHEELKYGEQNDEIYGVLIDAAWLWEEYLALLLGEKYLHCLKDKGKRFYLFEHAQQIVPDYLSQDKTVVADAKYIPLNNQRCYGEEKATSIYYKTIAYMYRFCTKKGLLLYPIPDTSDKLEPYTLKIKTEREGVNGGEIIKIGLRIPQNADSFSTFCRSIQENEQAFLKMCDTQEQ